MNIETLTGATLDCWVARGNGMNAMIVNGDCVLPMRSRGETHYRPSLVWSEGGAIIEHEAIELVRVGAQWEARCIERGTGATVVSQGPTHLIAAMRAFVKMRFGSDVEDDAFVEMHPLSSLPGGLAIPAGTGASPQSAMR